MAVITDIRTGAYTALQNVTGLEQEYTARPATVGALPAGWVDEARLDWLHDAGLRQWQGEVDVVLVVTTFDNEEGRASLDDLVSSLADYVSDHPHVCGANTVIEPVRVRISTEEFGEGLSYPAAIVTLGRFVFQEGR